MAFYLTPFIAHKIDRSKASYFTHQENLIILRNFENYKHIIKSKGNSAAAKRAREQCWRRITECVNSAGISNVPRTWRQIKIKYKNLMQIAHRRRRKQIQEALVYQEPNILESLETPEECAKSEPDIERSQEFCVHVGEDTMVKEEPHDPVPESTHTEEAENVQTTILQEASRTEPPEEELTLEVLQKKNIELDNIKKQLEIQKLRLEIEKLEYEKKMRPPLH